MNDDPRKESDEIADASLLFGAGDLDSSRPKTAGTPPIDTTGYEIEERESGTPPARPLVRPAEPVRSKASRSEAITPRSSGVDSLWNRRDEWGADLLRLGGGIVGSIVFLAMTFSLDRLMTWFVSGMLCLVGLAVLAYPIFITLERPVRMTPEQAAKDYFNALSHLKPHYKRMWLLLGIDGKSCPGFHSFEEFTEYWRTKIVEWKAIAGASGPFNPFEIVVVDFHGEKSSGRTEVEASYTANVVKRGEANALPVVAFAVTGRFAKGDDDMWYLDDGSLPKQSS